MKLPRLSRVATPVSGLRQRTGRVPAHPRPLYPEALGEAV